jgi:hypothetical protein
VYGAPVLTIDGLNRRTQAHGIVPVRHSVAADAVWESVLAIDPALQARAGFQTPRSASRLMEARNVLAHSRLAHGEDGVADLHALPGARILDRNRQQVWNGRIRVTGAPESWPRPRTKSIHRSRASAIGPSHTSHGGRAQPATKTAW